MISACQGMHFLILFITKRKLKNICILYCDRFDNNDLQNHHFKIKYSTISLLKSLILEKIPASKKRLQAVCSKSIRTQLHSCSQQLRKFHLMKLNFWLFMSPNFTTRSEMIDENKNKLFSWGLLRREISSKALWPSSLSA